MRQPLVLPDLGTGAEIRVSSWLADLGDFIERGERVVEVRIPGVTFDVCAPMTGTLTSITKPIGAIVKTGDNLGWIDAVADGLEEDE